jgi:hypothetical protein
MFSKNRLDCLYGGGGVCSDCRSLTFGEIYFESQLMSNILIQSIQVRSEVLTAVLIKIAASTLMTG